MNYTFWAIIAGLTIPVGMGFVLLAFLMIHYLLDCYKKYKSEQQKIKEEEEAKISKEMSQYSDHTLEDMK